jgi:hypothetical protein
LNGIIKKRDLGLRSLEGDPSLRKAPSEVERAWFSDFIKSERVKLKTIFIYFLYYVNF